ncbi:lysostaphin resistance A-like protein [Actinoplanes sp. NPDC049681]|uniref:lysostaphin resistance A-like protein n=1 Tax=Actinoplanes sp. NPDC049681 TaxID=3363905 RepID=UPI00378EE1C9
MYRQLPDRVAAAAYVVLVLSISLGTAGIAGGLLLAVSPALVTLLMLVVVSREGWTRDGWARLGLGRLGLRGWPGALAATLGVNVLAVAAVVAAGCARYSAPDGGWWQDLLALCVSGPILAFAEELGWRGYLQPRLSFLGERAAMLVIGLVWFAWHLPYILLTPYYHADGNRAVVLALFGGSVIAFSFLFGYLRAVSRSLWPAVLGHFAHNASFAWLAAYAISTDRPVVVNEYLAGDTGLFVLVGTVACATAMGVRRRAATSARR